jgi:hypothetical protein
MWHFPKHQSSGSAVSQMDILGVRDGILLLSRQRYRAILQVSSINFELKSEEEQDAIIDTYQSFLNSINSPLQFLVRTRVIDIDKYIADLHAKLAQEREPVFVTQIQNYTTFIASLVESKKILTRHFYIIVPVDMPKTTMDFKAISDELRQKIDIVTRGLIRLGMQSKQLSSIEVLDLFYSFYSPAQAKLQPITDQAMSLLHASFIRGGVG